MHQDLLQELNMKGGVECCITLFSLLHAMLSHYMTHENLFSLSTS